MAETKIYIPDALDAQLREVAMKRFGYGRGSISKAVETAIVQWLGREDAIEGALDAVVGKAKKDKNTIAVLLFGSYANKDTRFHDVDIALVVKDPGKSDFLEYDHAVSDVGMLYPIGVDIRILNNMPTGMQADILDEATVLYVSDRSALHDYCVRVMRENEDAEHISAIMSA